MNKLDKIRLHYYVNQDIIRESYPKCLSHGIEIKRMEDLSPIEIKVYETIKFHNLPLLPQFPVKKYFLDFGDPIKKIAIEVDGKAFHLDKRKDDLRQKEIENEGWIFYRIQGGKTYFPIHEYYEHLTGKDFENSSQNEINVFINQHKNLNSDCLILFLKENYYNINFSEQDHVSKLKSMSEIMSKHKHMLNQRIKRRKEWEEKFGEIKQ